ncbi:hypothetical protein CWC17_11430 [Pseudoalteromonas sp. S3785]|nr:hypothetical protein CWC17_11430 [Pseudoalteromonas sp. S3785]
MRSETCRREACSRAMQVTFLGIHLRFSVVKQSLYTSVKASLLKRQQAARLHPSFNLCGLLLLLFYLH